MFYVCLRAQTAILLGEIVFPTKPVSTAGCTYSFANSTASVLHLTINPEKSLHHVSYMYYSLLGILISVVIGVLVSFLTGMNDPTDIDSRLLAPFLRKYFKKTPSAERQVHSFKFDVVDNQIKV
jgi:hypothetical protein